MASFDVPVQPERPQEFLNYAQAASQPMPNEAGLTKGRALGSAIATAGKDVGEGLNLAATTTEGLFSNRLAGQLDNANQFFIKHMEDALKTGRVDEMGNILQGPNSEDIPESLKRLPGVVDNLNEMRASGKYSPTYQDMIRDSIVKSMRQQFPGFRNEIDNEFWRLTRTDPANKVVASLAQDINAFATSARMAHAKNDAIIAHGVQTGVWGSQGGEIWAQYQQHPEMAPKLMDMVSARAASDHKDEQAIRGVTLALKQHELQTEHAKDVGSDIAMRATSHALDTVGISADPVWGDKDSLAKTKSRIESGELPKPDGPTNIAIRARGTAVASELEANLWKKFSDPIPLDPAHPERGSTTMGTLMGGPGAVKAIIAEAKEHVGNQFDYFAKGDVPLASLNAEQMKAYQSDVGAAMLRASPKLAALAELNKFAGNQAGFTDQYITQFALDKNTRDETQSMYKAISGLTMTGQPSLSVPGGAGQVYALKDALTFGKNYGQLDGPFGARTAFDTIGRLASVAGHPGAPAPMRVNAVTAIADPKNADIVTMFEKDGLDVDPSSGAIRVKPGGNWAFNTLFSPAITNEVKRIGDPNLTNNYMNTVRSNFKTLTEQHLEELNRYTDDPTFKIGWGSDNTLNVMVNKPPQGVDTGFVAQRLTDIRRVEDEVNKNLKSLAHMDKELGGQDDTPAYFAQILQDAGLNPKMASATNRLQGAMAASLPSMQTPSLFPPKGMEAARAVGGAIGRPMKKIFGESAPYSDTLPEDTVDRGAATQ